MSAPTLIEGIRNVLVAAGMSSVFCGEIPSSVGDGVSVSDYTSRADPEIPLGRVSVQVVARASAYAESQRLAWVAYNALLASKPTCDRTVKAMVPRQEPFFLRRDEAGNYVQVFNLDYLCLRK